MKPLKTFLALCLFGSILISCQKQEFDSVSENIVQDESFEVPDIPDEIASLMSEEDILLFKQGPGESYLNDPVFSSARQAGGRWHPVLMALAYNLQFYPVSSCEPDNLLPCVDMEGKPTGNCPTGPGGISGITVADGNWFFRSLHSEYYPVFCLPDYAGYGQGFYQLAEGRLYIQAENTPFQVDDEGNVLFRRNARYVGEWSTGCFEGACGWEIMISYTAAENSPSNSPTGQGQSQTITFGWVFY